MRSSRVPVRPGPGPALALLLTFVGFGLSIAFQALAPPRAAADPLPILACESAPDPYLATTNFVIGRSFDREPAVIAFHGGDSEATAIELADIGAVGAVYGLAYDAKRERLYAAAYHKRNSKFGPLGPGGIYAIPLDGGAVEPLLQVPEAGRDMHDKDDDYHPDERGRGYAGKTSLGDIELDPATDQLFVMNLEARRIDRFQLPEGRAIGSVPQGAAGEPWAEDARPFGLAWHQGWLYQGLVDSAVATQRRDDLFAYVYASRADGSQMQPVAAIDLRYDRGRHDPWKPWPRREDFSWTHNEYPQAMLTDIAFDAGGNLLVGLRDRHIDTGPSLIELYRRAPGDVLRLDPAGPMRWHFDPLAPEHYFEDGLAGIHDEIAGGGLAQLMARDLLVSTAIDPLRTHREGTNVGAVSAGAIWLDNPSGRDLGRVELVYNAKRHAGPHGKAIGLGDLEVLCVPPDSTPTPSASPSASPRPSPTATPTASDTPPASSTPTATATATASATATATPTPGPIYLPYGEKDKYCRPDAYHTDVVLVLDRSTSMLRPVEPGGLAKNEAAIAAARAFLRSLDFSPDGLGRHDQVAVVGFNDSAWIELPLTRDAAAAEAALDRIAGKTIEGTRLDLAFTWGQKPLDGPERKPENRPVIIMLTDGLPNRVPFGAGSPYPGSQRQEDSVLMAVDAVKAAGTRVYTIGLGNPRDILPWLMIDAASERWMYYYAPLPEDLAGIYAQIAATFNTCDPRPAPTPCAPEEQHVDVVLVLDMSTSMYRTTRSGRTKHEAAIAAAHSFVDQLDLERDGWGRRDQVAVAGFNDASWTEIGMSDDRAAVHAAIDRLPARIAEGTRLDLALEEGQRAMGIGPRLQPNQPVIVLLTDGLPNRVPFGPGSPHPDCDRQECTVLKYASAAKAAGNRLFTIGLGESSDVLRSLLEQAATAPDHYYFAPDGEDL
ncbi:MAG: VWA domain-containing protein, partial [Chloroflexi bacterium]|nr:VWA domain-containing protein [Chloroflexota bacterium]